MSQTDGISIEMQVEAFQKDFDKLGKCEILDRLIMTLSENFDLAKSQLASSSGGASEQQFMKNSTEAVLSAKKGIIKDLRRMHGSFYKMFNYLSQSEIKEKNSGIEMVYSWIKTFKINLDKKTGNVSLRNYFEELEKLKAQLEALRNQAGQSGKDKSKMGKKDLEMNQELDNLRKNLAVKTKKNVEMKKLLDEYKKDGLKLIAIVEAELEQLKRMAGSEQQAQIDALKVQLKRASQKYDKDDFKDLESGSPGKGYNSQYPGTGEDDKNWRWFDCEKSQQRYEELLDDMTRRLKTKDDEIAGWQGVVDQAKKDKIALQETHFITVRDKDRVINDLEKRILEFERSLAELKQANVAAIEQKNNQLAQKNVQLQEKQDAIKTLTGKKIGLEGQVGKLQRAFQIAEDARMKKLEEERALKDQVKMLTGKKIGLEGQVKSLQGKLTEALKPKPWQMTEEEYNKLINDNGFLKNELMVEKEKNKVRLSEKDFLGDKMEAMRKESINLEADLIATKNQYEELKRQLYLNGKHIEHQSEIEARLRKDLNRNLNQDLDLRRERDQASDQLMEHRKAIDDRDRQITMLEKELAKLEDKSLRLARTVDKMKFDSERVKQFPTKTSINNYYPFPVSSHKKQTMGRHESEVGSKGGNSSRNQSPITQGAKPQSNIYYSNMSNVVRK